MVMKKISSRLISGADQHCRSVSSSFRYYIRKRNSRKKSKFSIEIDTEKRLERFAQSGFMAFSYIWLILYCDCSGLWLSFTTPNEKLPWKIREEIANRIYAERCSAYSDGHAAFQSSINVLYIIATMLIILTYPCILILLIHPDVRLRLIEYFGCFLAILVCFTVFCICLQFNSAITCRPAEIFFDLRFISILTTQFIGFIGCLLFAYKLGSFFAIKMPENISQDKTSFIPLSQSFVINLK